MSYYITNAPTTTNAMRQLEDLAWAIRTHWGVEPNNWARDVTLCEDGVRAKAPKQAQGMAVDRSLVLNLLRRVGGTKLRVQLENFCHVPATLATWLKQTKVL